MTPHMTAQEIIDMLLETGVALSRQKDDDALLHTILNAAMTLTNCDGGTLYIARQDALVFRTMVTKSMGIDKGGPGNPVDLPPVPITPDHVCALAVLKKKLVNIGDVASWESDFYGTRQYDSITGYRSRSMLVVPLENDRGDIIGVLQLINAMDEAGGIIPFSREYEVILSALASQAAIRLTNMNYQAAMSRDIINVLLETGISLSREKDDDALLRIILDAAMTLTHCDGGTLYIVRDNALVFRTMVTKSMGIDKGGKDSPIDLPPVPLSPHHVCAYAVLKRELINIEDVYTSEVFDFTGTRRYDEMTGYRARSMLVVPLEDDHGDIIGVLQLLNATDDRGETVPFAKEYERVLSSIASQAAIRLTNMNYQAEIIELLNSFVRVMSTAIDARSPYTANHTRNMVKYGSAFLDWLEERDLPLRLSGGDREQLLMSIWLHDVGKLVIPLEVMDKESRLAGRMKDILQRFETMSLSSRIHLLEGKITRGEYDALETERRETLEFIKECNVAGFLPDDKLDRIRQIAGQTWRDADGSPRPMLTGEEEICLCIRRGTLTDEEREIVESHVVFTTKMLSEMSFTRNYKDVVQWAGYHHERLNGSGYPYRLSGEQISVPVRILTIIDIYDALTARDRPYKPSMPPEKAFAILENMAAGGELDGGLVSLFRESRVWEEDAGEQA